MIVAGGGAEEEDVWTLHRTKSFITVLFDSPSPSLSLARALTRTLAQAPACQTY